MNNSSGQQDNHSNVNEEEKQMQCDEQFNQWVDQQFQKCPGRLSFYQWMISTGEMRELVKRPDIQKVQFLQFSANDYLTDKSIEVLCSVQWVNLKQFLFSFSNRDKKITSNSIKYILNTTWLSLEYLHFRFTQLPKTQTENIINKCFPKLQQLKIQQSQINQCQMSFLVNYINGSTTLLKLELDGNYLHDCVRKLNVLYLPALQSLKLGKNNIKNQDFANILKSALPKLKSLDLCFNQINSIYLQLKNTQNWTNLQKINLYGNKIKGKINLFCDKYFPNLQEILFSKNELSNQSIKTLCKSSLSKLKYLSLNQNKTTNQCMKWFLLANLPSIQHLSIGVSAVNLQYATLNKSQLVEKRQLIITITQNNLNFAQKICKIETNFNCKYFVQRKYF